MKTIPRPALIPACLLLLGLAMRTFGAWVYEFAHTSDHGIICLMVKHMLEGKDFPVFFYGLPYMGSLEPSVSAGLCFLFGLNGFWINMGTALMAFAFLPLVFLWGRGAAGWAAGVAALAFCVIGPPQYFQFESWADGGYAAIPLLSGAVLLVTVRMLIREGEGVRCSHFAYLGLGLIAGLGWWQSPLLIPAFLVSGFLFLVMMRQELFSLRLITGAAGFLLGSAPLWIWNVRNHWQTFDMVRTHDSPSLFEGLRLFYLTRLPDLLEFQRQPPFFRYALGALLILLAALALARLVSAIRSRNRPEALYLSAAFLFLIVFSILFGRSRFARVNALRYVLILIPVLGVLLGAATAWLTARVRWGLGWLPLVALVALQAIYLPNRFEERRETAAVMPHYAALGDFLREKGVREVYADYQVRRGNHALNYILNEEFVFSPLTRERYRPYARALELADHPAVLNAAGNIDSFLAATGGQAATGGVEGLMLHYNIRGPSAAWKPIWEGPIIVEYSFGKPAGFPVPGTWVLGPKDAERVDIIVRLPQAKRVAGFRLFGEEGAQPAAVAADGWDPAAKKWVPLRSSIPVTRYFWSGPRFYWGGSAFRTECFFPPFETALLRVRVKRPASGECRIVLLQPLEEDASVTMPTDRELDALAERIREQGYTRVYSDRWEAGQLQKRLDDKVALFLPPHVFARPVLASEMTLDEQTAIVFRRSESAWSLDSLLNRLIRMRRTTCGPWDVMEFDKGQAVLPFEREPGLRWVGAGCLRERDRAWARRADESARQLAGQTNKAYAVGLAERALSVEPDYQPLALTLAECYNAQGDLKKGSNYSQLARELWIPTTAAPAHFEGGVELLGIRSDPGPENKVAIRYYWRLPKNADLAGLITFVHIKNRNKNVLVQDDHPFLDGLEVEGPFDASEVWVEKRTLTLPEGVPLNELNLEMGLYRPGDDNRRLPLKSSFDNGKGAVLIPAAP